MFLSSLCYFLGITPGPLLQAFQADAQWLVPPGWIFVLFQSTVNFLTLKYSQFSHHYS